MPFEEIYALRNSLVEIVFAAGGAILEVYNSDDQDVQAKEDNSPVTRADKWAHLIIFDGLSALSEQWPVLSEEGDLPALDVRQSWQKYWLVDPLDGTKEFLNRTGEFTVNIALIEQNKPVLGIVYVPGTGECYFGGKEVGCWKAIITEKSGLETIVWSKITTSRLEKHQKMRIVASRRHSSEEMEALFKSLGDQGVEYELVNIGSSLKICLLAEGRADWYPRLAPTCEWDTAAAHAVLQGAGGDVKTAQLESLEYNTKDSMLNPYFHCFGDVNFDWIEILKQ